MTNRTYTHEEMVEEIIDSIEELGGEVVILPDGPDGFPGGFQLFVTRDLLDYAELIVQDIQRKYKKKRKRLLNDNPFIGTKELLENL